MRVKGGSVTRQRRKGWLKKAEGSWGTRHTSFKTAKQTVIRASQYAYRDRRNKKRDFRKLWISRINAAVRALGFTYSAFMNALVKNNVISKTDNAGLNRKMLSELAINNHEAFANLVNQVMNK
ncbi:50S ribosomal protein L20 [Ureaplasma zalophigenitalium]|uniref:Large ribosomal subunit protein bL20 n=1 Tax=Ureaplasma zalophigenitalium TaxID=907723 RepID=A0ABT3BPC9_9BACT|nr:50S ribosomal protein L20 [Ureaplasma zalophigenitalium]MCV3753873.1 50S ribosomal protein L20 [Ureaplasma zalophigenitalium]